MMYQLQSKDARDKLNIAELYQEYASLLLIYLRNFGLSQEDAEDIMVDVFVSALQNQATLAVCKGKQRAWLQRVAHNKMVDHYRRNTRRQVIYLEEVTDTLLDDEKLEPEQAALRHENQALLQQRLASLPAIQQEVLRLRFANDLRSSEIASTLNRSDTAIRILLSRAMNGLRTVYEREGVGEDHAKPQFIPS